MKSIIAVVLAAVLGVGVVACSNKNPNITVTNQTTQPNQADTGTAIGTEPSDTATSPTTSDSASTSTATSAAVTQARTATLLLITNTQNSLLRMYTAVHSLATHNGTPAHQAQLELQKVSTLIAGYASRAQQLPAHNPARGLLIKADQTIQRSASALQSVSLSHTTEGKLLALTDTITHLRTDVGRLGDLVTSRESYNVSADARTLSMQIAALTNGAGSGALSTPPPSTATTSSKTITTSEG